MWPFGKKSVAELGSIPLADLRKRTRILVIDDDENSFPYAILRKEGYCIDHWPKVDNLRSLEDATFDIIFLDIQGVAQEYSQDDGLGILEHIKQANPSQIVVAFSGHSFDLSKNCFWRLADDSLGKPVEATKCKQLVDNLIMSKMTPAHYWGAVAEILSRQGLSAKEIAGLEDKVTRSVLAKNRNGISEALAPALNSTELAMRVTGIACKIAALFGL